MRLTLVIPSLWGGGAERVLSILANGWVEQGEDVSILTFEAAGAPAYHLHPQVKVRRLDLARQSRNSWEGLRQNVHRIRMLRRAIRESQPGVVVSFMNQTNVLTVSATRGLRLKVVISERTSPRRQIMGRMWRALRRLAYPWADALVCPTRSGLAGFQEMFKVRGVTIPNPVEVSVTLKHQQHGNFAAKLLIAMGRLIPEKGFDLLLEAFAQLAHRHPDWSLTIAGEGNLRSQLEEQSKSLKIAERVHFPGHLADPFTFLRAGDLFVLSSRFEGFPMALVEAMACGLPVVSFDCPEGPREIIRDGIDGLLVPPEDVGALTAALDRLMSDREERARLAARAPDVTTRFSLETVLSQWRQLFDELLSSTEVSH
jgi:GalNAc-alpha-(1->4)-GalNAc-alpha-(1->3)-diNAcBac-PP-undecaprenol alpha-1,4-N-acetyl-D-galactosaminyltransferase